MRRVVLVCEVVVLLLGKAPEAGGEAGVHMADGIKIGEVRQDSAIVWTRPTPLVSPDRQNKNDNYANAGFTYEGAEIRKFLGGQKNMYVICGDRHWQYASADPVTGVREFSTGPSSDTHAQGFSESMRTPMHRYLRIKGGFLAVTVDRPAGKPTITFQHCGTDGKIYHQEELAAE